MSHNIIRSQGMQRHIVPSWNGETPRTYKKGAGVHPTKLVEPMGVSLQYRTIQALMNHRQKAEQTARFLQPPFPKDPSYSPLQGYLPSKIFGKDCGTASQLLRLWPRYWKASVRAYGYAVSESCETASRGMRRERGLDETLPSHLNETPPEPS